MVPLHSDVKMSSKFLIVCGVGVVSSLFIGYCVYFDRKRRSDPDYKKKVLARRRAATRKSEKMIDLRDPKAREEFLTSEKMMANQKLMEGNIEEAIGHLINLVQFSANPNATLLSLQQVLPPPIFNLLIHALKTLQQSAGPSSAKGEATDVD